MLAYRVFSFDSSAQAETEVGHPNYLHRPQGGGRADNSTYYDTWYYTLTPEAAIAEVFGDLAVWSEDMFKPPYLPLGRRVLGTFELPDFLSILDLDDARNLVARGLRPSQVVSRNLGATQSWALDAFHERSAGGVRRWDGLRWWSFWSPSWTVIALWRDPASGPSHQLVNVDVIDLDQPLVDAARRALNRPRR